MWKVYDIETLCGSDLLATPRCGISNGEVVIVERVYCCAMWQFGTGSSPLSNNPSFSIFSSKSEAEMWGYTIKIAMHQRCKLKTEGAKNCWSILAVKIIDKSCFLFAYIGESRGCDNIDDDFFSNCLPSMARQYVWVGSKLFRSSTIKSSPLCL